MRRRVNDDGVIYRGGLYCRRGCGMGGPIQLSVPTASVHTPETPHTRDRVYRSVLSRRSCIPSRTCPLHGPKAAARLPCAVYSRQQGGTHATTIMAPLIAGFLREGFYQAGPRANNLRHGADSLRPRTSSGWPMENSVYTPSYGIVCTVFQKTMLYILDVTLNTLDHTFLGTFGLSSSAAPGHTAGVRTPHHRSCRGEQFFFFSPPRSCFGCLFFS